MKHANMRKNIVYERLDVYNDTDSFLTWRESVFSFYRREVCYAGRRAAAARDGDADA